MRATNRFRAAIVAGCWLATCAAQVRADGFADRLKQALSIGPEAQVVWPPRSDVFVGAAVPADRPSQAPAALADRIEIEMPAERFDPPDAFWKWRSVIAARELLDFTFVIRKAAVGTADQVAAGPPPARVWHGDVTIEAKPRSTTSRADWNALRDRLAADPAEGLSLGANSIRLALQNPVIAEEAGRTARPPDKAGRLPGPKRWALATIASGYYSQLADMNQSWNRESAAAVRSALQDWKPDLTRAIEARPDAGLTRDQVLGFVDEFGKGAKAGKAELLVVYYIGHMERTRTGGLSLLMRDAPRTRDTRPPAPSGVGNLRELAQVIDQAGAELSPDAGTLDVAVLHRRLGKFGVPFVLLVDGCLLDPSYAAGRERLGILVDARGGEPLYVGSGDAGSALRTAIQRLAAYSEDFPWLRSRDATVLAATPGTLAYSHDHPKWLLGAPTGPIGWKLAGAVERTRHDAARPNLIRLLNWTADRQPIGQQALTGTVSWSDWLPHLRRFDPASFKR